MINFLAPSVNRLAHHWTNRLLGQPVPAPIPLDRPSLARLAQAEADLPLFVRNCPVAMKYLNLLGCLDWDHFPERPTNRAWPGPMPQPRAPFVAAYLVKLHEHKTYMSDLRQFLCEHPALVWLLGFPLRADPTAPYDFDVQASVPGRKQLGRVLRDLDNAALQFLLDSTVSLIAAELPPEAHFGDRVAVDTKHIISWVKENNPKAYVTEHERLDKTCQPKGDRDCKLGCKRKRNDGPEQEPTPPLAEANPAKKAKRPTNFSKLDEYFWGYASGVVSTKVFGLGEFVLAELTQTFDVGETTYFFPLMAQVERRLGRQPRFGALDAAFDCWYVHQYFAEAGGFAAVPFTEKGKTTRTFDEAGLPLCEAGLAMPCTSTFMTYSGLIPQRKDHYDCPCSTPTLPVRPFGLSLRTKPVRSTMLAGPRAAVSPPWALVPERGSVICSIVTALSTSGCTISAPPTSEPTARPLLSALSGQNCATSRLLPT